MSETFEPGWLALREPVDHRSRAPGPTATLADWWRARDGSTVLDLGCGTGSNLRYLAPRLPGRQAWTMIDHDARLLDAIRAPDSRVGVDVRCGDLAEEGISAVAGADLVTASALLDLVSPSWLERLGDACRAAGSAALLALSYDGAIEWSGAADPGDALVRDAVNAHQRRDKGLGPALGPASGREAEEAFRQRGYRTWLAPSPWTLGPDDRELTGALIEGWAEAAVEEHPAAADGFRAWAERRRKAVAAGNCSLVVGHLDLLALPEGDPVVP